MDGANVEIHREVGDENCVIFGLRANEVMDYYQKGGYSSWDLYGKDENIRRVLDPLNINGDFRMLYEALLDRNDEYFVLKDFEAYCVAQKEIQRRYSDTKGWLHSSTVNIAHSGFFSSDRTIKEYAHDIWHIKPIRV
jgi:starch phosphorylase